MIAGKEKWEMVIGLEVHIQLNTLSKAFCGDENRFGAAPNSLISVVSLAHPGTLPRINHAQIEKAIRLGLALDCKIASVTSFDRKNYFYPDLPKGYQITQDVSPICVGGQLKLSNRLIRLHHIHMEEDAGKSIHDINPTATLVDLNRAGVPLLELVTEPDFRSAKEVEEFLLELRRMVRWLGVSDGNMEEGSLRCDVNISLRPYGQEEYGIRAELKNLNSTRFARQAIAYEYERQQTLLEKGEQIVQETRQFDPATGITKSLRDKEEAHDYRYFADPDLPPVVISAEQLTAARESMPELPQSLMSRWMNDRGISPADAALLCQSKTIATWVDSLIGQSEHSIELAQFLVNKILPAIKNEEQDLKGIHSKSLLEFVDLLALKKVSKSIAYQRLFPTWISDPAQSPMALATSLELLLADSDADQLTGLIQEIIEANPAEVAKFKSGKKNLLGFFMGQLMKKSGGKIDPNTARSKLLEALK